MTLQFFGIRNIIYGLNFGSTGLTGTVDYVAQLKSFGNLQGLYLFLDTTSGSNYINAVDLSGNNNTAIARTANGYQTPVGNSSGVFMPAGSTLATSGTIFDTPIGIDNTNGFTRIWAGQQLASTAADTAQRYYAFSGSTKGFPATPAGFSSGTGASQRGPLQGMSSTAVSTQWEQYDLIDLSSVYFGGTNVSLTSPTAGNTNKFRINSLRINTPAATYSHQYLGSGVSVPTTVSNAVALNSAAAGQTFVDTHAFGFANVANSSATRPPTGNLSAFIVYSGALSDANNASAMQILQTIMQMRGISI